MQIRNILLLQIAVILSLFSSISFAKIENFEQGKKNLIQAFKLANLPVSTIEEFSDYTKGASKFKFSATETPWGAYYFPMNQGGISQRWQDKRNRKYFYPLNYNKVEVEPELDPFEDVDDTPIFPEYEFVKINLDETKNKIYALSENQINKLSPIEKFDLYKSDYDFKGSMYEKMQHGEYRKGFLLLKYWNGFCNGARAAGALAPEPVKPISVMNAEGVKITFQPADLKALLSASYFYPEYTSYLGYKTKLQVGRKLNAYAPNAAAFDIALRTYMAKYKKAFFMDKDPTHHLSNVTIIGYDRKIVKIGKIKKKDRKKYKLSANAVKAVKIVNEIEYLAEVKIKETNGETRHAIASGEHSHFLKAKYTLFVDKDNKIIDGHITRRYSGIPYLLGKGVDLIWFAAGQGDYHEWIDFSKKPDENGLYPHAGNKHLDYQTIMKLVNQSKI